MTKLLLGSILVISSVLWGGFVFLSLWDWFMIPLGLQSVTLFHAIGIKFMFLTINSPSSGILYDYSKRICKSLNTEVLTKGQLYLYFIILDSIYLLLGYIYQLFM